MLEITKSEAAIFRQKNKNARITTTCKNQNKGSKRGVPYIEETKANIEFLNELRNQNVVFTYGKID